MGDQNQVDDCDNTAHVIAHAHSGHKDRFHIFTRRGQAPVIVQGAAEELYNQVRWQHLHGQMRTHPMLNVHMPGLCRLTQELVAFQQQLERQDSNSLDSTGAALVLAGAANDEEVMQDALPACKSHALCWHPAGSTMTP